MQSERSRDLDLPNMRVAYGSQPVAPEDAGLDESWLAQGWLPLALRWLEEAARARIAEPNAVVLGTVDDAGHPVTRTVLCKGIDVRGVLFFTNYESDKGRQLAVHPHAAVTFPWIGIERQLHVRGAVHRVSAEETEDYWSKRPRGSQLGAWASAQSRAIDSRSELEAKLREVTARFDGEPVPVPPNWGGYVVAPEVVEFWQGRADRLHNRVRCTWDGNAWSLERLQP